MMITAPLITNCQKYETPISVMPLFRVAIISAPTSVPVMVPMPPTKLVPPRITAAIASSS
ncbi:hypothetical protein D3C85_1934950 [compost metagenome]